MNAVGAAAVKLVVLVQQTERFRCCWYRCRLLPQWIAESPFLGRFAVIRVTEKFPVSVSAIFLQQVVQR
jgi:hypothetical protein